MLIRKKIINTYNSFASFAYSKRTPRYKIFENEIATIFTESLKNIAGKISDNPTEFHNKFQYRVSQRKIMLHPLKH